MRTLKRVCNCFLEKARALPLVANRMPHDHHADDCVILAELMRSSGLGISTGKPSPSWAGRVAEEFCSAVKIAPGERIFQLCGVRFGINDLVSVRYFLPRSWKVSRSRVDTHRACQLEESRLICMR